MPAVDYEAEYNNRRRVPEFASIYARWMAAAGSARHDLSPYWEHAYGPGPRRQFDLFETNRRSPSTPLVVFVHGGYWQRGDRKDYSFIARRFVERGIDVVIPSYSLCPEATVGDSVADLKTLMAQLWRRYGRRPLVFGHSAGGHLAAAMLATDWSQVPGVPDDLVRAGYAISGVFDLVPLVATSINDALRLDAASAAAVSPINWAPPPRRRTLIAAVGGDESGEFIRQSHDIAARWSSAGVTAECVIVPATNHFTVLDELSRAESAMVARIAELAAL